MSETSEVIGKAATTADAMSEMFEASNETVIPPIADPGVDEHVPHLRRGDDEAREQRGDAEGVGEVEDEHEAGQRRVGEGLGRVGKPVEDDPAPDRGAGGPEQGDLGDRPQHELVLQRLQHQWSWW